MQGLVLDLETGSVADLFSYGPGFVRLSGWQWIDADGAPLGDVQISRYPEHLVGEIATAGFVTGHNILNFDLLALARYHGLDYEAAAVKSFDTLITEKHLDPVAAKGAQANGYYSLGQCAARRGVSGKDTVGWDERHEMARRISGQDAADRMSKLRAAAMRRAEKTGKQYAEPAEVSALKALAELYGGYDRIDPEDPDYRRYLASDVTASRELYRIHRVEMSRLPREGDGSQAYVRREHYTTAGVCRGVSLEGARVDVDFTMARWREGQARLDAGKQLMAERYGMPTEGAKPHTTNAGKAAVRMAMLTALRTDDRTLDRNWPLNKDGSLSTSKDVLTTMADRFETLRPEAAELCRTILGMNGERTVYGTVLNHLVGDRVHPYIAPDQSSGRWSMKNPGLTVLGKRGGKARERAMILADEGDVLVAIDADQIDARMIAALSQDPDYMALFGPGIDLHSEVAYRVWPDMAQHGSDCHQLDEFHDHDCGVKRKCHCVRRDQAKVFGHGWNYGMGWKTMVRQHGVADEVAQQFGAGMAQGFRVLVAWQERTRQAAGALGYGEEAPANDSYRILHTLFGRPVRVERNRAYTQACAQLGQGSTRDGMAEAVLKLSPFYRRRIRAIVHDEIVVSIPAGDDAQQRAQALADSMAYEVGGVNITFGCSRVARSWAGCYGAQYEDAV